MHASLPFLRHRRTTKSMRSVVIDRSKKLWKTVKFDRVSTVFEGHWRALRFGDSTRCKLRCNCGRFGAVHERPQTDRTGHCKRCRQHKKQETRRRHNKKLDARAEPGNPVSWTILDANTLRKHGENGLSADRAANALQVLAEFPELAAIVESWRMIAVPDRRGMLRFLPLQLDSNAASQ